MEAQIIQAPERKTTGSVSARKMRREGQVPAVLYGHGEAGVMLSVNLHDLGVILHHGVRILDLDMAGGRQKVMIKEVQYDPMGDQPVHVDFTRVVVGEKVTLDVPVILVGTAPGVTAGGILDHPVSDLEIECDPTAVPESIRVSVKTLEIGGMITVGDLALPEGVKVLTDPGQIVATVHPPKAVEAEVPVEGTEPMEPEVIGAKEREEAAKKAEEEQE